MSVLAKRRARASCQRIWYETPDGLTIQLTHGENRVVSFQNLGAATIQQLAAVGINQQGVTLVDQFFDPRVMTFQLRRLHCGCYGLCAGNTSGDPYNPYDLEPRQDCPPCLGSEISKAILSNMFRFRGDGGTLYIKFCDGTKRSICVFADLLPQYNFNSQGSQPLGAYETTVRFFAPSPLWMGEEMSEEWVVGNQVAKVCGTERCFPDFRLTGSYDGPAFFNLQTNRSFALNYNIVIGEVVDIILTPDKTNRQIKRVESSINGDITGTITLLGDFSEFALETSPTVPGGLNTIQILAANISPGNSTITMTWQDCHIGAVI